MRAQKVPQHDFDRCLNFSWNLCRGHRSAAKTQVCLCARPARKPPVRLWLASPTVPAPGSVLMLVTLGVWGAHFFSYFGGPVLVQTLSAWGYARLSSEASPSGGNWCSSRRAAAVAVFLSSPLALGNGRLREKKR